MTIDGLETIRPRQKMTARITYADGTVANVPILCRIDTVDELDYFKNGGILQYVLRDLAAHKPSTRLTVRPRRPMARRPLAICRTDGAPYCATAASSDRQHDAVEHVPEEMGADAEMIRRPSDRSPGRSPSRRR